jgi:hypothetical protein
MRYIKNTRVLTNRVMLIDQGVVLNGHIPAAKVDNSGASFDVFFKQCGTQTHKQIPRFD